MQTSCKNAVRNKKMFIVSSSDEVMLTLTDLDLNENIAKKKVNYITKRQCLANKGARYFRISVVSISL